MGVGGIIFITFNTVYGLWRNPNAKEEKLEEEIEEERIRKMMGKNKSQQKKHQHPSP